MLWNGKRVIERMYDKRDQTIYMKEYHRAKRWLNPVTTRQTEWTEEQRRLNPALTKQMTFLEWQYKQDSQPQRWGRLGGGQRVPPTYPGLSPKEAGTRAVREAKEKRFQERFRTNKRKPRTYGIYAVDKADTFKQLLVDEQLLV